MDTKLAFEECLPEYKSTWLALFKTIQESYTIEQVDDIEDVLLTIIQQHVPKEEAYFVRSLETGSLPHDCINKILQLLIGNEEKEEDIVPSSLPLAQTEKPIKKVKRLSFTRRQHSVPILRKTRLAKTRRSVKSILVVHPN